MRKQVGIAAKPTTLAKHLILDLLATGLLERARRVRAVRMNLRRSMLHPAPSKKRYKPRRTQRRSSRRSQRRKSETAPPPWRVEVTAREREVEAAQAGGAGLVSCIMLRESRGEVDMRVWISILTIAALAGCGEDPKDTKIAGINFADQAAVHRVAQTLQPKDRAAFVFYAKRRASGGAVVSKELLMPDGKEPATVREAAQLAAAAENKEHARSELTTKRNALVERKNKLLGPDDGLGGKDVTEWDDLSNAIDAYDKKIADLNTK